MKTAQMIENTFDDVAHRLPMSGSSVDVQRPHLADVKRRRRLLLAGTVTVLVAAATFGLSHLAPAAPEVDGSGLFIDTVKREGNRHVVF